MVVGDGGCEAYTAIAWGATLSLDIPDIAEAETVAFVEGNMCGPDMRGTDIPPGSKTVSRVKGTRQNLGGLILDRTAQSVSVRNEKPQRDRRRRARAELQAS